MDFTFRLSRDTRMGAWLFGMTSLLIMKTKSTKLTPNWRLETGVVQKLVGCTTTRGEAPRWLVACPPP